MSLITIVVALVIVGVVLYLLTLIPMDATVAIIIRVVVILATVLWLLETFGILSGGPHVRFR